jgi:hypothetical protein
MLVYCQTDVDALERLLPKMLPSITLRWALLRGRHMAGIARMERAGVPLDKRLLERLWTNEDEIKAGLIEKINAVYGCYDWTLKARQILGLLPQPWHLLASNTHRPTASRNRVGTRTASQSLAARRCGVWSWSCSRPLNAGGWQRSRDMTKGFTLDDIRATPEDYARTKAPARRRPGKVANDKLFGPVPLRLAKQLCVVAHLAWYGRNEPVAATAKHTGCANVHTKDRVLRKLEKSGWIAVKRRRGRGANIVMLKFK